MLCKFLYLPPLSVVFFFFALWSVLEGPPFSYKLPWVQKCSSGQSLQLLGDCPLLKWTEMAEESINKSLGITKIWVSAIQMRGYSRSDHRASTSILEEIRTTSAQRLLGLKLQQWTIGLLCFTSSKHWRIHLWYREKKEYLQLLYLSEIKDQISYACLLSIIRLGKIRLSM